MPEYYGKFYQPKYQFTSFGGAGTLAIYNPATSMRAVLTGLAVSSNLGGTFTVHLGNLAGTKIFEFFVGASATISPVFPVVDAVQYDRSFFGNVSGGGTDGFKITAIGFDSD